MYGLPQGRLQVLSAALARVVSLLSSRDKKRLNLCDVKIAKDSRELVFLKECVSDIGSGFFCCFHGTYKPAHMALRSGIENFMRFIAGAFDSGAITTTSIFELFDIAKPTPPRRMSRRLAKVHLRSRDRTKTFHVKHFCPIGA
jgi:hypothetical protein